MKVTEKDLEDFQRVLGAKLPDELLAAVLAENGGEWEFSRYDTGPFVPDGFRGMTKNDLWLRMLEPVVDAVPGEFTGRYLPIGDDYSGETVLVDLKTAPQYRVLSSAGAGTDRIACYEEVAATFEEYCAQFSAV